MMKTILLLSCTLLVAAGGYAGDARRGRDVRQAEGTITMSPDPATMPATEEPMMDRTPMMPEAVADDMPDPATMPADPTTDPATSAVGADPMMPGAAAAADPDNTTAWHALLNTSGGTDGALLSANATGNVTGAAPPCFGEGLYHLACYGNLSITAIGNAKLECLAAWMAANPDCTFSFDFMGNYAYGCTRLVVYHFPSLECHQSYQTEWEKTNPACKLYMTNGLGKDANRADSVAALTDYVCTMPTALA